MKTAAAVFLLSCCAALAGNTINLAGSWSLQLDPTDQGLAAHLWEKPFNDTTVLPGTIAQANKGNPLTPTPAPVFASSETYDPKHGLTFGRDSSEHDNIAFGHLYERFSYIGPAWYRRSVEIPKSWVGQDVQLELERAMWETRVWVNGQPVGGRNSLTTPHRYEISPALHSGRNEITIRVDDRRQFAIGDPHAYTEQAQSIWNGIIGRMVALTICNCVRI
jgi:hypothetical protein